MLLRPFLQGLFEHDAAVTEICFLTSERRPHGEVVVLDSQQLLRFCHWGFCHVRTSLVNWTGEKENTALGIYFVTQMMLL